jgi:Flp pilus assembly protein TadD
LHHALGQLLAAQQRWPEAVECYAAARALRPELGAALAGALVDGGRVGDGLALYERLVTERRDNPWLHLAHGNALGRKGDVAGAIREYRLAIDYDPNGAKAHTNLGIALYDGKKDIDGAIREFRLAIDCDPNDATAHTSLGNALREGKKDIDGAIREYRLAIDCDPKLATAYGALGQVLLEQGRFAEARTSTRSALELLPPDHPLRPVASRQLQRYETLLALDTKLPAVLKGEIQPASPEQRIDYGQVCKFKRLYHAATRFYEEAFAAKPELMEQTAPSHRYNAACYAALAGCGQGQDAKRLPDKVLATLRGQALRWLRADLALYAQLAQRNDPRAKGFIPQQLAQWQQDADLASVRDQAALDKLPADEQQEWRRLWDDVAALLKKVETKR